MANDVQVLKEYLVQLGFKVNEPEAKKFDRAMAGWDKRIFSLTKGLVGLAATVTTTVQVFAYQMEKLYYASKRTDTTVGMLQAMDYGFRRAGGAGGAFTATLEAMQRNMRANPGLNGLLNNLGVMTKNRQGAEVLTDLVDKLSKMPFYVAQRYGGLFGIDPDTLYMLIQGLPEIKAAAAMRQQMAAQMGVDTERAAEASKEYANQMREIWERVGLLKDRLSIELLPAFMALAKGTNAILRDLSAIIGLDWQALNAGPLQEIVRAWRQLVDDLDSVEGKLNRMKEGLGLKSTGGGVELSADAKRRLGMAEADSDFTINPTTGERIRKTASDRWYDKFMEWGGAKTHQRRIGDQASVDAAQDTTAFQRGGTGISRTPSYVPNGKGGYVYNPQSSASDPAALFASLERQYGLPAGTLDRLWKTESSRGAKLTGPMTKYGTAKGHFQFIDSTAQDYNLDMDGGRADRDDLTKSATAAAKYYSDLMRKYGGDSQKAAAAYNWGQGNLDTYLTKQRMGKSPAMPAETQDYVNKVAPSITQTNNISISGAGDPDATGRAVGAEIRTANSDLVRNTTPRVN